MILTDEEFRAAYAPLHVPAHYDVADNNQNKIIYALAQLGEGTVADVVSQLEKLEPGLLGSRLGAEVRQALSQYFDKGLLNGSSRGGHMYYNLSKVTHANDGSVDPELLASGLD